MQSPPLHFNNHTRNAHTHQAAIILKSTKDQDAGEEIYRPAAYEFKNKPLKQQPWSMDSSYARIRGSQVLKASSIIQIALAMMMIMGPIEVSAQSASASRVFVNLDKSMVPCNQELQYMLEDEMIELNLIKSLWRNISSDTRLQPYLQISRNLGTSFNPYYQYNLLGLMNNTILSDSDNMVGTAAWLKYPLALHDMTKFNFTLRWSNVQCNLKYNSLINCSPQGGFALVFQQESTRALGEYKNNLGQGLGYEGLSGIFAIEFDTQAIVHSNVDGTNQLRISMQIRNKNTKLLSSAQSSTFKANSNPMNFASFNLSGFNSTIQVQFGILTNQLNQQILLVLDLNGQRQLQVKTTYAELGLDPTRTYYAGFTTSQNLNKQAPTATLDILNFRVFKGKPKYVDGQVSYIGDTIGTRGNQSNLEVRSSFYDLCNQKTSLPVYPSVSEVAWQTADEPEPHIIPFYTNRDSMIVGSSISNLNKPLFYSPSSLTITSDVKYSVSLPTGVTTNVRMGFYYGKDLIMNITAIDYYKITNLNYTFLVIKNSDLISSTLNTMGYANNLYQFTVDYYNQQLTPVAVDFATLQLTVTSDYIRLNNSIYSNIVPLSCYGVSSSSSQSGSSSSSSGTVTKSFSSSFTCQFTPNVNGTYYINSPYLPSARSFSLNVGQADQVNEILSSEYSQAIIQGDFEVDSGSMISVLIDLRNNLNNTYVLSASDNCVFTSSYYTLNGVQYSFLFYNQYPYLRTQINQAGVANFKITITCTSQTFDLQCYRCQKIIKPITTYLYYQLSIPAYPSTYDIPLATNIMLQQGTSFVIDATFYDRYDNVVPSEVDTDTFNSFQASFNYGTTKKFNFLKVSMPGKIYFYLNDSDNFLANQLRARTNLYYLSLTAPGSSLCFSTSSETRRVFYVPKDKSAPIDVVGDGDTNAIDINLSTVVWDSVATAGQMGKISFILKNANGLQMNTWLQLNDTTKFQYSMRDASNKSLGSESCYIYFTYGLYESEYFGFFVCYFGPRFYRLWLTLDNKSLFSSLPIYIRPGNATQANLAAAFPAPVGGNTILTLGNNGLNITFSITDQFGNAYDSALIDRDLVHLGLITYSLTQRSTNIVQVYDFLPMVNITAGTFRIFVNNLPIGPYRLRVNLPIPQSYDFTFNSSSTSLSARYSFALLDNPTQNFLNAYVVVRFFARNIHNQTMSDLAQIPLLNQQLDVYIQCSNGQITYLTTNSTFVSTDGVYYNFTSTDRINSNGVYTVMIYLSDARQYIHVKDGVFSIQDNFEPNSNELYMVKGLDEKEYRLAPFSTTTQINNQYNATYYDPRFDGTLRFRIYLRTVLYGELVTNPRFNSNQTIGAYLAQAKFDGSTFSSSIITSIKMKVVNFTSTFMIVPNSTADQDQIEKLAEGYYFIQLNGTNWGSSYSLQWLFALFNSDNGQNTTSSTGFVLLTPRFLNITAGEPFSFIASAIGGTPSLTNLTLASVSSSNLNVEWVSTSGLKPSAGYNFYVTLYCQVAGIYTITLTATYQKGTITNPPKEIIIQVNPGPFYQVTLVNTATLVAKRSYTVGTLISFNFTLQDRWGNDIFKYQRTRPSLNELSEHLQFIHFSQAEVQVQILPVTDNSGYYQCSFTTEAAGIVSFIPSVLNYTNTQTLQSAMLNVSFTADTAAEPGGAYTYASLRQNTQTAGTNLIFDIYLFDDFGNSITSTQQRWLYLVNVIPDNTCNATTQVLPFQVQRINIMTFTLAITQACNYQLRAYYFSGTKGQVDIPCPNCYVSVLPADEDVSQLTFLDSRDVIVSAVNKNRMIINNQDTNPKLIMTFRDSFGNLVTSPALSMTYTYQFTICSNSNENTIFTGVWQAQRSFHYLQFCTDENQTTPCFSKQAAGQNLRLRIIQRSGTKQVSKTFISIQIVNNYGMTYNMDDLNPISLPYSYLRILNQDSLSSIAFEQQILSDTCQGGNQYPIIGRIDLKTTQGFRRNETFDTIQSLLSLTLDGVDPARYTVSFYSGSSLGLVMFSLFVQDDYYVSQQSAVARLRINGQEYTNKLITVQCRRRYQNYQKYLVNNTGSLLSSFEQTTVKAGEIFSFRLTAADPQWQQSSQFIPYEDNVFFNYTANQFQKSNYLKVQQDFTNLYTTYQIKFETAGSVALIGYMLPNSFALTVIPGSIHYRYTTTTTNSFRISAGENATIFIDPFDEFGNEITFSSNTASELTNFNSMVLVYLARKQFYTSEVWTQVQCYDITAGRVKCSTPVQVKGIYQWRVLVNGYQARCQSCFFRVAPTGTYNHNFTVLTDLSQNYYDNQELALAKFNVQTRDQGLFYKIFIADPYNNVYMNEDFLTITNVSASITYSSTSQPLNVTKIHRTKTSNGCQVYQAVIYPATLATFPSVNEGIYTVQVKLTTGTIVSTASFQIFVKTSRTSTTYPSVTSSSVLQMNFRTQAQGYFTQTAGRFQAIQFAVFDSNQFLQNISSNSQDFTYLPATRFATTTFVGDYMLGPFKFIYSRLLRIDLVNQTDIIQQLFTQAYTITVNITNPSVSITQKTFTTYVFPGSLSRIVYSNNASEVGGKDSLNNDIDLAYDPSFFMRLIQLRNNTKEQPPFFTSNFKFGLNYTKSRGELSFSYDPKRDNLTQYQIIDSTSNATLTSQALFNPFRNYSGKGSLDIDKSYFEVSPAQQVLTAGEYVQIKVSLVDRYYQKINLTTNATALSNIRCVMVMAGQKTQQVYTFATNGVPFSVANGGLDNLYTLRFQVTQTGLHYIQVSYYNQSIQSRYGAGQQEWLFVMNDPETGNSSQPNMQWQISAIALKRNEIEEVSETNGTDYITLQQTQPLYMLARICDRFGNPFLDNETLSYFSVNQLGLQSYINNFGRAQQIDLLFVYNIIIIQISSSQNRDLFQSFLPSYYPTVSNQFYNALNSFSLDIKSPNIPTKARNIFLVISSDFAINEYTSRNQTVNAKILATTPMQSDSFMGNSIQLRMNKKQMMTVKVLNADQRPYLTEQIQNFSMVITNTTPTVILNSTAKPPVNVTVQVPVTNVTLQVIPYSNPGYYRLYFYSPSSLYQEASLNTMFTIKTAYTHNTPPIVYNTSLWVFPPVPPNFKNPIDNRTFLSPNQTKFTSATKVQFNLTLKYNNLTYMNDYQSAYNILIYRSSTREEVTGSLINKSVYQIAVNLEGPSVNEFRIYYQDPDSGALYPLTTPEVIYFQIKTGADSSALRMSLHNDDQGYMHPKLGIMPKYADLQGLSSRVLEDQSNKLVKRFQLKSFDMNAIKIVILSNILKNTYIIGNEFKASILIVDSQTARCLPASEYNINSDLVAKIYSYNPTLQTIGAISIDVPSITLVNSVVSLTTSYCTYYAIAGLETSHSLDKAGNYTLIATFMGRASANITFQAKIQGIDFSKTTIGWYQQPSTGSDELIAEFNAYDEFNYLIYFSDAMGNKISDRQSQVQIKLNFDQQKLVQNTHYSYISRYDDRFKGYLITIRFFKAGSFKPEYYFNLQRAENINVENGPIIFVVHEPQCISVKILSRSGVSLSIGQLFTFVFQCYDINGNLIADSINGVKSQALFQNTNLNNQPEFGTVAALSNGIYQVSHKFYQQGRYLLKVYFNQLLIYSDSSVLYQVNSEICKDVQGNILFKCPNNPSVCAYSYHECRYINTTACPLSSSPFQCGNGQCVSSMSTQCCRLGDINFPNYLWCPNTNQCFNTTSATCATINTTAQLYCQSKSLNKTTFVTHQFECCEDLKYNISVTVLVNGTRTQQVQTRSMVKCSNEDKCVPQDTAEFCFVPFKRDCGELFGSQYSYQCPNDGKCQSSPLECPSPRVCPVNYTMCPDGSCIQGINRFSECNPLQNCTRLSPDQVTTIEFLRCADGSCAKSYEECPSQISCMAQGQIVCPDGSCQNSAFSCVQPLQCTADKPYQCPGQPSVCAKSRNECPMPVQKSCGNTQSLCADGDCSDSCLPSSSYQVYTSSSATQTALTLQNICNSMQMIQCPNMECRNSYFDCSDSLYCPNPTNYTYAASSVICSGAKVCALDISMCSFSQCSSELNDQFLPSQNSYDKISLNEIQMRTCYDGRCHYGNRMKQNVCMTPLSCSFGYFKSGGFGEFCVSSTNLSISLAQVALFNSDHKCSNDKFKCVTGECRKSIDDCPSQITCPAELPIQCRDGQCVQSKTQCVDVDKAIEANLLKCANDGLLLCTSDLITCTSSLSKCPSRSTCPIGFIKCWDESCVNPETSSCPKAIQTNKQTVISTCEDKFASPFHCFADGTCRSSLQDCPSQIVCPLNRPVKCMDGSCRASAQECPRNINCQTGYRFCSGEGTCVKSTKQCGTPETCASVSPFKCEDGTCVSDIKLCLYNKFSVDKTTLDCYKDSSSFVCQSNKKCIQDPSSCPSSDACFGTNLVKAQDSNLCYGSRSDFSQDLVVQTFESNFCEVNNMHSCTNGTCSDQPCEEWLSCTSEETPIKCSNGQCVSNQILCPLANGCPQYKPIRCNYTGACVSNLNSCYSSSYPDDSSAQQYGQSICQNSFSLTASCFLDGSCQAQASDCPSISTSSCLSLYPNNNSGGTCMVPQCPPSYPFKCNNGLCVLSAEDCPLYPYSIQDITYCNRISNITGFNQSVPCGNGQCVAKAEECLPLYDCSLNSLNGMMNRCNDGTCRAKPSDCPIKYSICPSHIPFMCINGMCASSQTECLSNQNGCPASAPFKCSYDGSCTTSSSLCISPFDQMAQMFIYPNFIPLTSTTPLIAYYGITRNTCQKNGQFVCRIRGRVPFCLDNLKDCVDPITGCSVINPIRCGSQCVKSQWECKSQNSSCALISASICSTTQKCVATSTDPIKYKNSLLSGAQQTCDVANGCPSSSPFQCPNINRKSCQALPYTSFSQFYNQSCGGYERSTALQVQTYIFNQCFSSDTPYSCADGSCVSEVDLCPTCIYYCSNLRRCVKSKSDCDYLQLLSQSIPSSTLYSVKAKIEQQCPLSMPNRCILSGKCVANSLDCSLELFISMNSQFNQSSHGHLWDDSCPQQAPIKCYTGQCVVKYDDCLRDLRNSIADVNNIASAFNQPIPWGSLNLMQNQTICQVYCFDGSCRDRVENCPPIHGCTDLTRPYRCSNGLCTLDSDQCLQLLQSQYDTTISDLKMLSNCSNSLEGNGNGKYDRCEDGVCRPLFFNGTERTSSCLPFMGCPLYQPYQCSTGECVQDKFSCAGASRCPSETPFRCRNFECVNDISACERPFSTYPALQLDITLDPYQNNEVNFAFSEAGEVLGKFEYISNAFNVVNMINGLSAFGGNLSALPSALLTLSRLQIYPVPDSILQRVLNIIPSTRIEYMQSYFPLDDNITLPFAYTLLSPAIKIELTDPSLLQSGQDFGYLYFRFDKGSFPGVLDIDHDVCLGFVNDLDNYISRVASNPRSVYDPEQAPSWQCVSREMQSSFTQEFGFLKFKISMLGIYALILNPNPDAALGTSESECGFICQNHQMLLILELVLVAASALIICALCICCHSKEVPQKQKKNHKNSIIANPNSFLGRMSGAFNGGYYYQGMGAINYSNTMQTPEKFLDENGFVQEMDVEELRDHLEGMDPNDPPLMPGQYVFMLNREHETQQRQIDTLKSQLQELTSREADNLALIKAIFEKNKILHAQIELKNQLEGTQNSSGQGKSGKNSKRRPKKVIEDPSIMSAYNNIDAYLLQSALGSKLNDHPQMLQPVLDAQASRATFQEFPGAHNTSVLHQINPNDNSLLSIPLQNYNNQGKLVVSESTRDLIIKNSKSVAQLEAQDLHEKMSNMLIQDNGSTQDHRDSQRDDYNRRLGELADEIQLLEKIDEEGDEDQPSIVRKNNAKRRQQAQEDSFAQRRRQRKSQSRSRNRNGEEENSSRQTDMRDTMTNVEASILSKTLNSIFPNKRKNGKAPSDTKGFNMFLGNESITGNVSGNIIKLDQVEPEMQRRYEEYVNSKEIHDGEASEDEINESSFNRLKEIEQIMKSEQSSAAKGKKASNKKTTKK